MRLVPLAVVLAVLLPCATAQAEDFAVQTTSSNSFTPDQLTVKPGDSVTFSNPGEGFHNVVWVEGTFDDGSQASPADPTPAWPSNPTRTFTETGTFHFYCKQHGTPKGAGMAGTVTVGTPPPPGDERPPLLADARAGVRKRRPFVAFKVFERIGIEAVLFRKQPGPDKRLDRGTGEFKAGRHKLRLPPRDLKPGRYYIGVTATDEAGNSGPFIRVRFRVR
jgi:plastocyanin